MIRLAYDRFLRPLLPRRVGTKAGVFTMTDGLLDRRWNEPDYKSEPVTALKHLVEPGDHVVVVGGGIGVTAVWAARKAGPKGHVDIFEPFEDMAATTRQTLELNGVLDRCSIHREGVTADTELPGCDVLEVDCEGCERHVLQNIDISPRVIIVEHHA